MMTEESHFHLASSVYMTAKRKNYAMPVPMGTTLSAKHQVMFSNKNSVCDLLSSKSVRQ